MFLSRSSRIFPTRKSPASSTSPSAPLNFTSPTCSINSVSAAAPTSSVSPSSAAPCLNPRLCASIGFSLRSSVVQTPLHLKSTSDPARSTATCFPFKIKKPPNRSGSLQSLTSKSFCSPSVANRKPNNAPQRLHAVLPRNLFSFFVRPPRITDRHLINPPIFLRDLRRNLGLESKPVGLDLYSFQNLCAENLVARLHVRQLQIRKNVRQQCQHRVRHIVPEIVHALWPAQESRSVDHVRAPVHDRLQQFRIVPRVVFQIRVLHQHDLARDLRKSPPQCRAFSPIFLLKEKSQILQRCRVAAVARRRGRFARPLQLLHLFQHLPCSIRRKIVHQDNFLPRRIVYHTPQQFFQRVFFVVNRNYY